MTLSFRVTNAANATEWSCEVGNGAVFPPAPSKPTAPNQNVMNPEAVNDNCYSREDPDPDPGFFPPPGRPRRATWFSFDQEAGNTLVVGQTVHCIDEDGHGYDKTLITHPAHWSAL